MQPYLDVLLELQNKREEWGRIAVYDAPSGTTTAEKKLSGALEGLDFGQYEFAARRTTDGSELYARWMGA